MLFQVYLDGARKRRRQNDYSLQDERVEPFSLAPASTLRGCTLGNQQSADNVPTSGPYPMLSLEEEKGMV